jgi:hypothetical protein
MDLHPEEAMLSDKITHCERSGNKPVFDENSLGSSFNTASTEEFSDDYSLGPGNAMSNTDPDDKEELHLVVEKLTIKEGGEEETSQVDSKEERKEIVVKTETLKTTKVAFSSVEIKVYPYILGDNPSVSKGSPLTIDWEPMAVQVYDSVDAYETARGGEGYAPRDHFNLLMPMELRESYIRQTDYTQTERRLARKAINISKSNRKQSVAKDDKQSKSDYKLEKSVRAIRNVTWGRSSKQKERHLIEQARHFDLDRSEHSFSDESSFGSTTSSLKKSSTQ